MHFILELLILNYDLRSQFTYFNNLFDLIIHNFRVQKIPIMSLFHKILLTLLTICVILLVFESINVAGSYYFTQQIERPRMAEHGLWKPSGDYGHGLGILGTTLILGLLTYSLRKRYRVFRRWGYLSTWLKYHIFMGIAGPVFIILHTTLKFNGLVSVSFWSMMAVALSGFIGRYIYVQIPRARDGMELSISEMELLKQRLFNEVRENYHLASDDISRIEKYSFTKQKSPGYIYILFGLPIQNLWIRIKMYFLIRQISKNVKMESHHQLTLLRKTLVRMVILSRRTIVLEKIQKVFHYWHIFHKPFAFVMIIILFIHVGVTVYMGFTWIF